MLHTVRGMGYVLAWPEARARPAGPRLPAGPLVRGAVRGGRPRARRLRPSAPRLLARAARPGARAPALEPMPRTSARGLAALERGGERSGGGRYEQLFVRVLGRRRARPLRECPWAWTGLRPRRRPRGRLTGRGGQAGFASVPGAREARVFEVASSACPTARSSRWERARRRGRTCWPGSGPGPLIAFLAVVVLALLGGALAHPLGPRPGAAPEPPSSRASCTRARSAPGSPCVATAIPSTSSAGWSTRCSTASKP